MLSQRHRGEEVFGKDLLARLRVEVRKAARRRTQQNITLLDLGEAKVMKELGDGKEFVNLEL